MTDQQPANNASTSKNESTTKNKSTSKDNGPSSTDDPSISVMVWFRADPLHDDDVEQALGRVATVIQTMVRSVRIGHRREEDRAYRTWMIDAGPLLVPADLDAMHWRLQKALRAAGIPGLSIGESHAETFVWRARQPCA